MSSLSGTPLSQLDGGAGSDTITSRHTVTAAVTIAPNLSNIETHNFRIDADGGAAEVAAVLLMNNAEADATTRGMLRWLNGHLAAFDAASPADQIARLAQVENSIIPYAFGGPRGGAPPPGGA